MEYAILAAIIIASYLFGSVPFGLVVGKAFYGKDIRYYGSGNIGATNAFRSLGLLPGAAVLAADFMKGFLPVVITKEIFMPIYPSLVPLACIIAGVIAMVGHNYSVFLKFKGGKGMSTAAGFITAIWPQVIIVLILVWILVVVITRYVSLASIIVAILFPVMVVMIEPIKEYVVFSIVTGIVAVYRHRSNISRLKAGTELRIGMKAEKREEEPESDRAE